MITYADDIEIIGRTKQDVTAAFSAIKRESTKMGLAINEGKTEYMLSTSHITADNYALNIVKEFLYHGSAVTTKNNVNLEITLTNRCYYSLNG